MENSSAQSNNSFNLITTPTSKTSNVENSSISRKYSPSRATNELDSAITAGKSNPVEKTTNVLRPMLSLESAVRFGLVGNLYENFYAYIKSTYHYINK